MKSLPTNTSPRRSEVMLTILVKSALYAVITFAAFTISGCMLFNPVKRMPLDEVSLKKPMPRVGEKVVVLFEDVVAGKPLNETVWDNAVGPFWDPEEAQQIGLTVSYRIDPVYMSTGASAATTATGARWVVPFGPLISTMMKSALDQYFLAGVVCYSDGCAKDAISTGRAGRMIKVKSGFKVWTPSPTSLSLNYSSDLSFSVYSSSTLVTLSSGKSSLIKRDMKLNPIISYSAINEMRKYSKEFAESVVADVLSKAFPTR
ncbi:hypothetical protein [Geomesophilobacter sediminis]|uniref:Uncharacterized protein n=1 Tax=Geomesophilobacter sediminis TaxID=2798584 RepID=A0A8J7JCB0_9BACT|nr:hypothetical protein [Geomesophilobacter sediminis]MBJ6724388.1 hypothetical protein [Geomesophilobacter sediminis]